MTMLERLAAERCKSFQGPLYGHPHTCPEQGKKVHQYCYPCKLRAALAEEAAQVTYEYQVESREEVLGGHVRWDTGPTTEQSAQFVMAQKVPGIERTLYRRVASGPWQKVDD